MYMTIHDSTLMKALTCLNLRDVARDLTSAELQVFETLSFRIGPVPLIKLFDRQATNLLQVVRQEYSFTQPHKPQHQSCRIAEFMT
jgi:hypothetical protein